MKNLFMLGLFVILPFTGCLKNNFTVQLPSGYEVVQNDYKLKNISVQVASDSEKTGDLDFWTENSLNFTKKVEDSLIKVLTDNPFFLVGSEKSLLIDVQVLKNDAPLAGLKITVHTDFLYKITDQNGKILYENTISSFGTAEFKESFLGSNRVALANNRSVKRNIKLFLDDIRAKKIE